MVGAAKRRSSRSVSAAATSRASSSLVKIEDLAADHDESYDELEEEETDAAPVRMPRKRGRPRGSKNKRKVHTYPEVEIVLPRRRGRPRRSDQASPTSVTASTSRAQPPSCGDFFSTLTKASSLVNGKVAELHDPRAPDPDSDDSFDTPPPPPEWRRSRQVSNASEEGDSPIVVQQSQGPPAASDAEMAQDTSGKPSADTVLPGGSPDRKKALKREQHDSSDEALFAEESPEEEKTPPKPEGKRLIGFALMKAQKRGRFKKLARKGKIKGAETTDPKEKPRDDVKTPLKQARRSPTPQSVEPDFVFAPPDEAMFEEVRKFLDRPKSDDESSEGLPSGSDVDIDEYYERRRRRKLEKNRAILAKLGLGAETDEQASPRTKKGSRTELDGSQNRCTEAEPLTSPSKKQAKILKLADDGTTLTLPPSGESFEVAIVDIPPLRDRVRSQFILLEDMPEPDPVEVDEWPEWDGRNAEGEETAASIRAAQKAERKREREAKRAEKLARKEQKAAASSRAKSKKVSTKKGKISKVHLRRKLDFDGTSCHQCRRKTPQAKMQCSAEDSGQVCGLFWCSRCLIIRYGIESDPARKDFVCPRCAGYCNCSRCLREANLEQFIPESISKSLATRLKDKDGNVLFESVKHYLDKMLGRTLTTSTPGVKARVGWSFGSKKSAKRDREDEGDEKVPGVADDEDVDEDSTATTSAMDTATQKSNTETDGAPAAKRPRKIILKMKHNGVPSEGQTQDEDASALPAQRESAAPLVARAAPLSIFAKRQTAKKSSTLAHSKVWVKSAADMSDSSSLSSDLTSDEDESDDDEDDTDSDGGDDDDPESEVQQPIEPKGHHDMHTRKEGGKDGDVDEAPLTQSEDDEDAGASADDDAESQTLQLDRASLEKTHEDTHHSEQRSGFFEASTAAKATPIPLATNGDVNCDLSVNHHDEEDDRMVPSTSVATELLSLQAKETNLPVPGEPSLPVDPTIWARDSHETFELLSQS